MSKKKHSSKGREQASKRMRKIALRRGFEVGAVRAPDSLAMPPGVARSGEPTGDAAASEPSDLHDEGDAR